MNITPAMIHSELERAGGLSGREVAHLLRSHQVKVNERQVRHYMTGRSRCPDIVFRAIRDLAQELESLSNDEWQSFINRTRSAMQ